MLQSGSTHLLRDFTEESIGQSLSDSESESNGSGLEPKMLKERRRPARSGRERLHQTLHAIFILIILALIFGFFRSREDWRKPCVERQSIYCSSNQSLTVSLEIKASSLLISPQLAPVLDVLSDEYQTWKFNGTFRNFSPYKGPPNEEVDKAWADLFTCTPRSASLMNVNNDDVVVRIILNRLQQLAPSASPLPTSVRSAVVPQQPNSLPKPVEAISDLWKSCTRSIVL